MRSSSQTCLLLAALALGCAGENQTFPDRPLYDGGAVEPLPCTPNLDGVLTAEELAPTVGVPASYLVSPPGVERAVDLAGVVAPDGGRVWDLDLDYADDAVARIRVERLAGQWFEASFPEGEIVVPLDAGGRTLGVARHDARGFFLYGIASAEPDPPEGQTLLVYAEPVALYRFPMEGGESWVDVGEVTGGTLRGLPYNGRDVYEVSVGGAGTLELPGFVFEQARRVDTRVTVEPAVGAPTSRRQTGYLFECFGEVARATSRPDETEIDFTTAAELRRLSL